MMKGVKKYLCGNFLGQFTDQHDSPPPSDEEGDATDEDKDLYMPRDYHPPAHKRRNRFFGARSKGTDWGQFLTTVSVDERDDFGNLVHRHQFPAIRAHKRDIVPGLMDKLPSFPSVHTVEIISCKLKEPPPLRELRNLVALNLSRNELVEFVQPEEVERVDSSGLKRGEAKKNSVGEDTQGEEKPYKLEVLQCDRNKLEIVAPRVLAGRQVANLKVLNLSFNSLNFLPGDFASGAGHLKYLDLSHNRLFSLPEGILECRELIILNADNNDLERLPKDIGLLRSMRKLSVSYNKLTELPYSIGDCRLLEKIRMVSNQVAVMPQTLLHLWKSKGGRLEELLVDGNPLQQPSLTAFQMGGLDRAMRLFAEWVREQQRQEKTRQALAQQQMQEMQEKETEQTKGTGSVPKQAAGRAGKPKEGEGLGLPASMHNDSLLTLTETEPQPASPVSPKRSGSDTSSVGGLEDGAERCVFERSETSDRLAVYQETLTAGQLYYFSHCLNNAKEIMDVRCAESSLLLRKKTSYVRKIKLFAKSLENSAGSIDKATEATLRPNIREMLEVDFDASLFSGKIDVQDIDIYFSLLVYGSKASFSSIHALWDKYETGEKGFMTKDEWMNLCTRVATKLPEPISLEIWELMTWRNSAQLFKSDFIAGWHIHDTEVHDTHIARLAEVLKLDFYGMSMKELQERARHKLAADADIDYITDRRIDDRGMPSRNAGQLAEDSVVDLPAGEGERRVRSTEAMVELRKKQDQRDALQLKAMAARETLPALPDAPSRPGSPQSRLVLLGSGEPLQKIQVSVREQNLGDEHSDGDAHSMDSWALSRHTLSSDESFDAQDAMLEQTEWEDTVEKAVNAEGRRELGRSGHRNVDITSDEQLAGLMELPVDVLVKRNFTARTQQDLTAQQTIQNSRNRHKKKKKKLVRKHKKDEHADDPRFRTNVMSVRRAIREAYRSMPFADFKNLISYFSRKLKFFKSDANKEGGVTYLHGDDPIFKNSTIGNGNPYAAELMRKMGFYCLGSKYWVWPAQHLDADTATGMWLPQEVPQDCVGRDRWRLHDMISLFAMCHETLLREGNDFTGHMRY
eukprot:TRINITY_DN25120_c1_g1_i1.p1 TRINITY_DN25120_c1_g1~~TRINITY_DN25120_c1_g1_i1.p1  ORF type:complete len:1080 (-),score=232.11 TRINITY_DN25120_c1_g1_i1:65-3304(-)